MNTWVTDNIPRSGGAFLRQLIVDLYRNDGLMQGTWVLRGERLDVANIKANLISVIARDDHITLPCQSETLPDKISSTDKEIFRVPGGHIGIMAGSQAAKRTWPYLDQWLGVRFGKVLQPLNRWRGCDFDCNR